MRLKQRPEDFSVKESFRFDEVPSGSHRVYLMDKQKLSTFDAIARIRERFGLKPMSISYCGLKDKQGRTEQLIAVDGFDVDMQDEDLRLKFLGRTDRPLSAANITSNRFSVTVRAVRESELPQVNLAAAEVNRLGVVNYFDDQRFGSLKHGQGYIAKDLLRGDHEAALRNYMAVPSALDRTDDAKVKKFWGEHWGDWSARCPFEGNRKYFRILSALRENPRDFLRAFLQIDSDYRAMQLFTFQSWLWNEGVRRLLQLLLPREHMFPMPYQAGTLLFHREASPEVLQKLRGLKFPLLSPETKFEDDQVREAAMWALGKDKLTLEQLRIKGAEKLLYFKHELRPLLVYPHKLVLGKASPDELNRPHFKLNVAFTLPPGSYATLVVKRLFHFSASEDRHEPAGAEDGLTSTREDRGGDRPFSGGRGRDDARGGNWRGERSAKSGGPRGGKSRDERGGPSRGERGDSRGGRDFSGGGSSRSDSSRGGSSRGGRDFSGGDASRSGGSRGGRDLSGGGSSRSESARGGSSRGGRDFSGGGSSRDDSSGGGSSRGGRDFSGGSSRGGASRGGSSRGPRDFSRSGPPRGDRGRRDFSRDDRGGRHEEGRHVPADPLAVTRDDHPPAATGHPTFSTGPRRGSSGFYPANPGESAPRKTERGSRPQKGGYRGGGAPNKPFKSRNRPNFRRK